MLITNFSAGELSETLFGRIDLEQYYKAAARIENFDIIPTGGIHKRSGTERLAAVAGDGRVIPFIVSRELSFLLFLRPGNITVYKLENGDITEGPVDGITQWYQQMSEIRDVHYAQNFDIMVLCHENYPPLEARLIDGHLHFSEFAIDIRVDREAREGINTNDFFEKDQAYENAGWLMRENEWPRTVTFFGGRIVFAGTRGNPQRVFASKAGDIYKFATYRKFITETRDFIAINGIIKIGTDNIVMTEPGEIGKFRRPLSEFFVQSPFFDEGTMIAGIQGHTLRLTRNTKNLGLNDMELGAFLTWKNLIEAEDRWSDLYLIRTGPPRGPLLPIRTYIQFKNGHYRTVGDYYGETFILQNAERCVNDRQYLFDFVHTRIGFGTGSSTWHLNTFNQFIDDFWNFIQTRMRYTIFIQGAGLVLYGTPAQIYQQILNDFFNIEEGLEVQNIVSFFSKDFVVDRYPTPDNGFTFEIASDISDAIRWAVVNKGLIVGTETGEWVVPPGTHATNVQAMRNSRFGSDKIQGAAIGGATCFFRAGKKGLVEYYIPQQDNNFRANNMAMLAPQMLRESDARELCYTSSPHAKLFIIREDGTVVTLLYDRSTAVFAWARFSGAGYARSLAVTPGKSGYDDVYLIVQHGNNFFLERLEYGGKVYLDSFAQVDADNFLAVRDEYIGSGPAPALCRISKDEEGKARYETFDLTETPDWASGGEFFIGYPYKSEIRTMPILTNARMARQRITSVTFRFLESYLPFVSSIAGDREIQKDTITSLDAPYSGVHKIPFPGTWDKDVQVGLTHERPEPVKILAINAEVQ